jgi:signal transduction histidine kinase
VHARLSGVSYGDGVQTVRSLGRRVTGRARPAGRAPALPQVRLVDALVAGAFFVLMAAQFLATRHPQQGLRPTTPLAWFLAVALCAPILTHRQFPRASLVVCLAALIAYAAGQYVAFPVVVFAMVFELTLHAGRRIALAALFSSAAAIAVALSLQPPGVAPASTWAWSELLILASWATAQGLHDRQERLALVQARAELLERDRAEEARRAVTEERLRIARELHDVVAHSMSVIAVQSGVGGHVMDTQPEEARKALAAIEATSRSALTEMRRLLGVLRAEGEPGGALAPTPGLADLSSLLSQVSDAGLKVWVQVTGDRFPLPPGVDMSAYRVIQEALTNVLKHASSSKATVTIGYAPDAVTVEVADEGPARVAASGRDVGSGTGSGHGIIGMRERVAVFGGELTAGPRPTGGFLVRASFPVEAAPL